MDFKNNNYPNVNVLQNFHYFRIEKLQNILQTFPESEYSYILKQSEMSDVPTGCVRSLGMRGEFFD